MGIGVRVSFLSRMIKRRATIQRTITRPTVQPASQLKARGLRSRESLKRAAKQALNERGYQKLRVQDVTEKAGVATGLFYRYFHDLDEIVIELAEDFFSEVLSNNDPPGTYTHPYEWLRSTLKRAVDTFAQNPGIVVCLFGLAGNHEDFDRIWKRNAHVWNLRLADFLRHQAGRDVTQARRLAYLLGAMTEGVIYQTLVRRTEDLNLVGSNPAQVADALATLFYRAVFLADPPKSALSIASRKLVATSQVPLPKRRG